MFGLKSIWKPVSLSDETLLELSSVTMITSDPTLLHGYISYLRKLVETMKLYTTNDLKLCKSDYETVLELITRCEYTILIFTEIHKTYQDEVPDRLDFIHEMKKVSHLTSEFVNKPKSPYRVPVAICVEINVVLKDLVERYYTAPVKRSLFNKWF